MRILFLSDGTMHSAWTNKRDAEHQREVLRNHGYKGAYIKHIEHNYENGHYFI